MAAIFIHQTVLLTCLDISTSQFTSSAEMDSDEFTLFEGA